MIKTRDELEKLALPIDVSFDKNISYSNDELLKKLCDLKPVIIPVLKAVKIFTPKKVDEIIDKIIKLLDNICDKKATDKETKELFKEICSIYLIIKPFLHIATLIPGKVGQVIKKFLNVVDVICSNN